MNSLRTSSSQNNWTMEMVSNSEYSTRTNIYNYLCVKNNIPFYTKNNLSDLKLPQVVMNRWQVTISLAILMWNGKFAIEIPLTTSWHPMASSLNHICLFGISISRDTWKLVTLDVRQLMKDFISHEIVAIPQVMTKQNFRMRLQECIAHGIKHLNDIIFKTKWSH